MKQEILIGYKEKLFYCDNTQAWGSLPREVVQTPSLEIFKSQLDKILSNLVWPQSQPCFKEIGEETSWNPF